MTDSEYIAEIKVTQNKKHPSDQYPLYVKIKDETLEFYNTNYVNAFPI